MAIEAEPQYEPQYWWMSQAIAWVCTRDETVVRGITEPGSVAALTAQIYKYSFGQKFVRVRIPVEGSPGDPFKDVTRGKFSTSADAVHLLQVTILAGEIITIARNASTGALRPIPGEERLGLEFRIWPDDPIRPYGFCPISTGMCRWARPLLSALDVRRLFPAPHQSPTIAAEGRIYASLRQNRH